MGIRGGTCSSDKRVVESKDVLIMTVLVTRHHDSVQGCTFRVATTASLHDEEFKGIFLSPKKSSLSA